MGSGPLISRARVSQSFRTFLRPARAIYVAGVRHVAAMRIRRELRTTHLALPHAIEAIIRRWGGAVAGVAAERPIFIFGAGWRCGSTWLQRLVMSSGEALIWGEPFDRSCIVQTMSSQLVPFGQGWPSDDWFVGGKPTGLLADQWIANLYPPVPILLEAHRSLFRELFEAPARERGMVRWGFKEIRLTIAHARYLRLLFPAAKFVFLVRNPFDAYESYRGPWEPWFERWPDRLTVTARQFGRMWARLAQDFVDHHATVEGLLLRYEDLLSDSTAMEALSDYLELALEPGAAARPIRGNPHDKEAVPGIERRLLTGQVRELSRRLGYL
jgi:Sulfotransferase family